MEEGSLVVFFIGSYVNQLVCIFRRRCYYRELNDGK